MIFDGGELKNNLKFKNSSSSFPEAEWCDQSNKYKKGISKNVLNFILLKLETSLMIYIWLSILKNPDLEGSK